LDDLAERRMGCEPDTMSVPRETLRDRDERLYVTPRADGQDRDRQRRNRPALVGCLVRTRRLRGTVKNVLAPPRGPSVELDLHAVAIENRYSSDRVVDEGAQARMVKSAVEQAMGRVRAAHLRARIRKRRAAAKGEARARYCLRRTRNPANPSSHLP